MADQARLGPQAEQWTASELERRGWRLLARNLRTPAGEIDLLAVAPDGGAGVLVAVEVKARHPLSWAQGEESLRPRQRRRLGRAVQWAARRLAWPGPLRVDLAASVWLDGRPVSFELYEEIELG